MATKNLARTVVEGGRENYNKHERRSSSKIERHRVREFLHCVCQETINFEECVVELRRKVYKDRSDKLNPAKRWLESRIGKDWNRTHSLIFKKFDIRTMAGRHIVFDHLLPSVVVNTDPSRRYYSFTVDENGILVHKPQERFRWERDLSSYEPEVTKWLARRFVGVRGKYLFWFVSVTHYGLKPAYRQAMELSSEETEYFYFLSAKAQRELLVRGAEYIPNLVL